MFISFNKYNYDYTEDNIDITTNCGEASLVNIKDGLNTFKNRYMHARNQCIIAGLAPILVCIGGLIWFGNHINIWEKGILVGASEMLFKGYILLVIVALVISLMGIWSTWGDMLYHRNTYGELIYFIKYISKFKHINIELYA